VRPGMMISKKSNYKDHKRCKSIWNAIEKERESPAYQNQKKAALQP
jgi:hypothetical protein